MADTEIFAGDTAEPVRARAMRAGLPIDLTGASSVRFIMSYPDGTETFIDAPADLVNPTNGEMAYYFSGSETDEPGEYEFWFKVTFPEGTASYGPKTLLIKPSAESAGDVTGLIVLPTEAFLITAEATTPEKLRKSQALVGLILDAEMSVPWYETLSVNDRRRIREAISWGTVEYVNPSVGNAEGISSISELDRSITYVSASPSATPLDAFRLHPFAERALSRLSWMQGKKTIYTSPFMHQAVGHSRYWRWEDIDGTLNTRQVRAPKANDDDLWVLMSNDN